MPTWSSTTVEDNNTDTASSNNHTAGTIHTTTTSTSKERVSQLVAMCRAMGGPRYRNFALQPGQVHDNVKAFKPLLEQYLHQNDASIDDVASFADYFGQDIGLHGWTLLRAASSVWVNAPQVMKLLLQHGADPLHKDSSGRHIFTEALSTARHGYQEPWNILEEHAYAANNNKNQKHGGGAEKQGDDDDDDHPTTTMTKTIQIIITPEILEQAKLSDTTESLIKSFREGKTDVGIVETRQSFLKVFESGFHIYKKWYQPDVILSFFEEMNVISLTDLRAQKVLPSFADAGAVGGGMVSVRSLTAEGDGNGNTEDSKHKLVFISHRWLQPWNLHPDDADGSKRQMIVDAGLAYCQKESISPENLYLWIDYTCINQPDSGCKFRSIQTLPFYIMLCDGFVAVDHSEYMTRAWCQLEAKFGACMTVGGKNFGFYRYTRPPPPPPNKDNSVSSSSPECLETLNPHEFIGSNPERGKVSDPSDLAYIQALSWFAADMVRYYSLGQKPPG
mmetsp:Transcript_45086/g.109093  ORF Transcript_45086/g.109093 Transcript_45086/m.109093 type:complete len:504 (-) Transcript_45086:204-1715(-)|eukprot:CAMPEP_0113643126 /NCGR_PEP_ID=MMETSP0017_2-20120614/22668_1 /TAXON_ID=2856 /ORGANISM="Cylindrotheca closterium" /LENGTH=503 /DNA_ID=CAMNT_0000554609 /DNA_START=65 /DNA_END=1576 /DNA_ORIENTATION=+ /assembly_acc=CAM_ASM_000147